MTPRAGSTKAALADLQPDNAERGATRNVKAARSGIAMKRVQPSHALESSKDANT